jgi:hypothetical protein
MMKLTVEGEEIVLRMPLSEAASLAEIAEIVYLSGLRQALDKAEVAKALAEVQEKPKPVPSGTEESAWDPILKITP